MYDAAKLTDLGEKLDGRADRLVITHGFIGFLLGGALGVAAVTVRAISGGGGTLMVAAVLGGVAGFLIGEEKAFELRLRAQTIFCLVAIEANSRRIP